MHATQSIRSLASANWNEFLILIKFHDNDDDDDDGDDERCNKNALYRRFLCETINVIWYTSGHLTQHILLRVDTLFLLLKKTDIDNWKIINFHENQFYLFFLIAASTFALYNLINN